MRPRHLVVNPFEVAIFAVVLGVLGTSVHQLFHQKTEVLNTVNLEAATTDFRTESPESMSARMPAVNPAPALTQIEVPCLRQLEKSTHSERVRLTGVLCNGSGFGKRLNASGAQLLKTTILNQSNQFEATVFTDTSHKNFSTDYIPLVSGKNPIHIEFSYFNGKRFVQDLVLTRI